MKRSLNRADWPELTCKQAIEITNADFSLLSSIQGVDIERLRGSDPEGYHIDMVTVWGKVTVHPRPLGN